MQQVSVNGNHHTDNIVKEEVAEDQQCNEGHFKSQAIVQRRQQSAQDMRLEVVQYQQQSQYSQPNQHQSHDTVVPAQPNHISTEPLSQGKQAPTAIIEVPAQIPHSTPISTQDVDLVKLAAIILHIRCTECRAYEMTYKSSFHSSRIPPIPIWDYLRRIAKYSDCSPECFIMSIMMLDRYVGDTGIPLTFTNIHRLTITAVMITAKVRDDIHYPNSYFASIGGVQNQEINMLEIELLSKISWWTWSEPAVYNSYLKKYLTRYRDLMAPSITPA
eukprot:Tbor_TRINITY_DN3082_c0_g1::TRINITY_DN3082_c0_g1_i1::g.17304::m.17304